VPATARDAPDSSAILGWLAETPAFKRAARERDAAVTAERERLIRELNQLEDAAAAAAPKRDAQLERATADVEKIAATLRAAQQRLATAHKEKHEAAVEFSRQHNRLEAELRATASPLIAAFVAEMNAAWAKTRREPLVESTAESEIRNPRTGRHEQYIRTNVKLVAERMRVIRETILAAQELTMTVADQSTIPALLGELAAKLPPMI
jgi:predicted ATPase